MLKNRTSVKEDMMFLTGPTSAAIIRSTVLTAKAASLRVVFPPLTF